MSGIKSTSIVALPCWPWKEMPSLEGGVRLTGLAWSRARSIRWTFPPITVAYCGMSFSLFGYATTVTATDGYYREKYLTDGVSLLDAVLPRHCLTCRIAEMDWCSIRQVDFQPCSVDLTSRWRLRSPNYPRLGSGHLMTWSQPFASMLQSVSEYGRAPAYREMSDLKGGRRPLGYPWWESSPNAAGTGRILVGLSLARGAPESA